MKGQNKKEFEKWYKNFIKKGASKEYQEAVDNNPIYQEHFYELAPEMQQGVILAYYSSLKIQIQPTFKHRDGWNWKISYMTNQMNPYKVVEGKMKCNFHVEKAYKEAFKKANELRNEQLK